MQLKLLPLTPDYFTDHPTLLRRLAHVHLTSFLTNAVYAAMYPAGYSQTLIDTSIDRHRTAALTDPTCRYLAAIDGASLNNDCSNLIAFAKYQVFASAADESARKDTAERKWPADMNKLVVDEFWGQIQVVRRNWGPKLGAHVQVDILATDPEWMRQGAGRMIMGEIGRVADEMGLAGFLEGSPEGVGLYRWAGFEDTGERVRLDLGRYVGKVDRGQDWRERERVEEGGKAEGWYENVVMVRPALGKKFEEYLDGEN